MNVRTTSYLYKLLLGGIIFFCSAFQGITSQSIPFNATTDLYVLEDRGETILRITPAGGISVVLDQSDIIALTGDTDIDFPEKGIAFDTAGNLYFSDDETNSILKLPAGAVASGLIHLTTNAALVTAGRGSDAVDPDGLILGDDGFLYVTDDGGSEENIFRIDPVSGAATVFTSSAAIAAVSAFGATDMERGIVAAPGNQIIVANRRDAILPDTGKDNEIIRINKDGVPSVWVSDAQLVAAGVEDLKFYMTLTPNGDVLAADDDAETIFRISLLCPVVTTFLQNSDLNLSTNLAAGISISSADLPLIVRVIST